MLKLIQTLESEGHRVYLWTDHNYGKLSKYHINESLTRKRYSIKNPLNLISYIRTKVIIERSKWIERLMAWTSNNNIKEINQVFDHYLRSSLSIFSNLKPDFFYCWNPFCCHYGIAYDVAKALSIKTKAIEWGYLPNTFILDNFGTLAKSEVYINNPLPSFSNERLDQFQSEGEGIFENLKNQSLSLYNQKASNLPIELIERKLNQIRILVLAIDEVDAGAIPIEHKDRFGLLPFHKSSFDQAQAISKVNPEYAVIFKAHPSHNKYKENKQIATNLWIVNGNPDELIDWADVVFCSGSKMEFSVLLRNKPLINFGAGLLYGKDCAYEIKKLSELDIVVSTALKKQDFNLKITSFKTFLGYLKNEYLFSY